MARTVREVETFSKAQVEEIMKTMAKITIIGRMYIGNIGPQTVTFKDDGSVEVVTEHTPMPMGATP